MVSGKKTEWHMARECLLFLFCLDPRHPLKAKVKKESFSQAKPRRGLQCFFYIRKVDVSQAKDDLGPGPI